MKVIEPDTGVRRESHRAEGRRARRLARADPERPPAVLLGDSDMIRALGLAGIRSAPVARAGKALVESRFVTARIEWADHWHDPEGLLANLLAFASTQGDRPPLFYQHDGDLAFVSRHRGVLSEQFRFVIGDPQLVEDLLDKTRFSELAERLGLPVPRSAILLPQFDGEPPELPFDYPVILKPLTRVDSIWLPVAGRAKALRLDSRTDLDELWPELRASDFVFLAQELIPGGEERVESYHVYVDERGEVAGEFTGAKIRTFPAEYGQTTALTITDQGDVYELGRHCMAALGLRGVAKLDFKRDEAGRLLLLEVNPRFNLWHLPGAVAGVNLPAMVYADLLGLPRPAAARARAGVRWTVSWDDLRSARAAGMSMARWAAWQLGCETRHLMALDDPMPILRGIARRLHLRH